MGKATKPAAELEAMILSKMQTLSECPPGMTVTVKEASRRNLGSVDGVAE
jgi:hypothetical protein